MSDKLKLMALDAEDLSVISSSVQDALVAVRDCAWFKDDKRFEGIPVLMHSSLSSVANQKLGQQVGVDAYVPKFNPEDLARMLTSMMQKA